MAMTAQRPARYQHMLAVCVLLASGLVMSSAAVAQDTATDNTETKTDRPFIDEFRDDLTDSVNSTAAWLDSFFGEEPDADEYDEGYGRFSLRPEWDAYEGFKLDSSFRANIILPHAEQRFSAFIGRDDFDDFINNSRQTRPSVIRRDQADEEWMLGLGFAPVVGAKHNVSFSAGFRGGLDLDPYLQSRYSYETILSESSELRLQTVGFWRDSDGFGIAQTLAHEQALSDQWFNRFWVRGTFAERTDGVRWHASNKLLFMYHPERAIGAEVWWYGETEDLVPMQDYGFRALHRSRLNRDWLYLESWIGLHWPREELFETRHSRWMVGVELELRFGR